MLLGLISGKSKYFGECIEFIALVVFVKSTINYTSVATLFKVAAFGAVVTKSFQPYSIISGVPAKLQKMRFTPEQIEEPERKLNK